MIHASLFSGIGGFDYAAELMGWENIFHCEWSEFCQKVLKYHFPKSIAHNDITKTDFTIYRGRVDILTGGFPCQPYSVAGAQKGTDDERHLWPEMLRAICEIQPTFVVGENVPGLVNWNGGLVFEQVQADLEDQGYEVTPFLLPAAGINAPHIRERIWFIAFNREYSIKNSNEDVRGGEQRKEKPNQRRQRDISTGDNERLCAYNGEVGDATNPKSTELENAMQSRTRGNGAARENSINANDGNSGSARWEEQHVPGFAAKPGLGDREHHATGDYWRNFPTESPVCNGDDGLSARLDAITFPKWRNESIKAGGNAIVPQVALQIFKAINEFNAKNTKP